MSNMSNMSYNVAPLKGSWQILNIFTKQGHSMYQLIVKQYRKFQAIEVISYRDMAILLNILVLARSCVTQYFRLKLMRHLNVTQGMKQHDSIMTNDSTSELISDDSWDS